MPLEVREETPVGVGAVSVVRIRGDRALERVQAVFALEHASIGVPRLARLVCAGEDLDEAIVCALSPRCVEIHLHGSPVLVRAVMTAFAPQADAGVPSCADGSTSRARALLPHAPCESAARILLDQAEGAWRAFLGELVVAPDPRALLQLVQERSRGARHALEPALIVLAGPVNAGKSTLFNALVGERRAITSPVPGTTRDLVRARVMLGRYAVDLVDTAGERDLDARDPDTRESAPHELATTVERAGIERARRIRAGADLVVWLCDASLRPIPAPPGALSVFTQADRVASAPEPALSAATAPQAARVTLARLVFERLALPDDPWTSGSACAFDPRARALLDELGALRTTSELRGRARAALEGDPPSVADGPLMI